MIILSTSTWADFKTLAVTKQLALTYTEWPNRYEVYLNEGVLVWNFTLPKDEGADVINFETYYKAAANQPSFFHGQFRNKFRNITGNDTVTVKSGKGVLRGLSINNSNTGGTVTIYDNTSASGTKLATYQLGTPAGGLLSSTGLNPPIQLDCTAEFATGLTIVTSGSAVNDITVYYV